jgi:hypothetical protein
MKAVKQSTHIFDDEVETFWRNLQNLNHFGTAKP